MRRLIIYFYILCLACFHVVLVLSEQVTNLRVRLEARQQQLQLSITFDHDGSTYLFSDLKLVTLVSYERIKRSTSSSSTTFRTGSGRPTDSATWATVTLLDNDRIIGLFYIDNGLRTIHVDTTWTTAGEEDGRRLDLSNMESALNQPCATITQDELKRDIGEGIAERNARRVNSLVETRPPEDPNGKDVARSWAKLGLTRRRQNTTRRNLEVDSWFDKGLDCYNKDHITRRVSIGIVVDAAMERRIGLQGFPSTEKYVEALVATASAVYLAQMNIEIVVGQIFKPSDAVTSAEIALTSARYVANSCKTTYNDLTGEAIETICCDDRIGLVQRLELIRAWGATLPLRTDSTKQAVRQAHWHLLTDCHPSPGFVGRTFIGTLCHATYAAGVSSFGPNSQPSLAHWRIFAHELGHAFNASHSFEKGQGRTGGIMDYGDGLYNGEHQFHPLKRDEVCTEIDAEVDSCMFFETKEGRCGDGIVERFRGEECECPGNNVNQCPDCSDCKLVQPSQCVRGSMCCSSTGKFLPSNTQCDSNGRAGVCVMGTCQITVCGDKSSVCAADPCRVRCAPTSQPTACSASFLNLPDLTPCPLSLSTWGQCIQGECAPIQPSSNAPESFSMRKRC